LSEDAEPRSADSSSGSVSAARTVAAMMAGATAVMWAEAAIRFLLTKNPSVLWNLVLPEKTGDVAAIWLVAVLIGLVAFCLAYLLFRRKRRIGSLKLWTIILLLSVILRYL
jgi:LPXTG-motif cell wall-anchored protein